MVNGEPWTSCKPSQVEVRVSSEGFDSGLAKMISTCLPKNIFQDVAATKAIDLGEVFDQVVVHKQVKQTV